jgi:hypothetical protein
MPDPKLINPPGPLLPEDYRPDYDRRAPEKLIKDVNTLWAWMRASLREKDLMRSDILWTNKQCAEVLEMKKDFRDAVRYANWTLVLSVLAFIAGGSALVWLALGG